MSPKRIGVAIPQREPVAVVEMAQRLERMGVPAAWLTLGGAAADSITMLAAAAVRTERILLGTCIVPTWPRHPIAIVQQAQALAGLAPGRFRLGLGPGHKQPIESTYGYEFTAPLGHLSEYLHIVKTLLRQGEVDFDGKHYQAHTRIAKPITDLPVMASALRAKSFELCGAETDGAISWVCPGRYLKEVCIPAIQRGAQRAVRTPPPLLAHAPVCVHDDRQETLAAAREQVGNYPRIPFYAAMFQAAGYPEASQGTWSERMIDAVVLSGKEETVAKRLRELLTFAGEIIVTPVTAGADRNASLDRTLRLVAEVAKSV